MEPVLKAPLSGLHDFSLDRRSAKALSRQLYDQLRERILNRVLPPGSRLPSTRQFAEYLGLSRNTICVALDQLAKEGYLEVSPGRRATVVPAASTSALVGNILPRRTTRRAFPISDWAEDIRKTHWPFWTGAVKPLFPGLPDPREFPHDLWARSLRRAGRSSSQAALTPNRVTVQEALANHLQERRGVKAEPRQVIVTPTAQAALMLIGKVLLNPGDLAWVETPGYGGTKVALDLSGLKIRGIPLDLEGLSLKPQHELPRLICVTPSHQYPTGRLMSIGRRQELLSFAEHAGAMIVEDDYDSEFHYQGPPVASLQALDESGRVIYVGSFSKTMCGKARGGYMVVPAPLVDIFTMAQRHYGIVVAPSLQDAFADFIEQGHYASTIRSMTRTYRARRDALVRGLQEVGGRTLAVTPPAGGMQLVAYMDRRYEDRCMVAQLEEQGVITRPLSSHFLGRATDHGLFMGFATWNEREIERGVEIIGRVVRRLERRAAA